MTRKLHQTVKTLDEREKRISKMLEELHKLTGIKSNTEIVRYCIKIAYDSTTKGE